MWKLNIPTPKGTSLAQNTSSKPRLVTIHPPVRQAEKEGREKKHPKQWQTGYSPRPPTSSDQNRTLHGGWPSVCSYACHVSSNSVKGSRRCGGRNGPSPLLWPVAYTTSCTTVQAVICDVATTPGYSIQQYFGHINTKCLYFSNVISGISLSPLSSSSG